MFFFPVADGRRACTLNGNVFKLWTRRVNGLLLAFFFLSQILFFNNSVLTLDWNRDIFLRVSVCVCVVFSLSLFVFFLFFCFFFF